MQLQILDFILGGIMLISGLLAMMRGFTREVLSLVAWGAAALAAFFAVYTPELVELAQPYTQNELLSKIAVGAVAFLIVLIIMSMISVKLADLVLDSAAGGFDRTLGFGYGLARGMLLVVIAYLFYIWLIPPDKIEEWVRKAQSRPAIEKVGDLVISFLPAEISETLQGKKYLGDSGQDDTNNEKAEPGDPGYKQNQQRQIDQLIESTQGGTSQ
ncbi:MAG: CvpA family protein [Rhizobiales bacterium]|nr:CvpA family protein [Hyphomicrobiales bacterium]